MNKGRQRPFAAIVQTHFDEALAAIDFYTGAAPSAAAPCCATKDGFPGRCVTRIGGSATESC